jgi:hypothetical protein
MQTLELKATLSARNRGVRTVEQAPNGLVTVRVSKRQALTGVIRDLMRYGGFQELFPTIEGRDYIVNAVPV